MLACSMQVFFFLRLLLVLLLLHDLNKGSLSGQPLHHYQNFDNMPLLLLNIKSVNVNRWTRNMHFDLSSITLPTESKTKSSDMHHVDEPCIDVLEQALNDLGF